MKGTITDTKRKSNGFDSNTSTKDSLNSSRQSDEENILNKSILYQVLNNIPLEMTERKLLNREQKLEDFIVKSLRHDNLDGNEFIIEDDSVFL